MEATAQEVVAVLKEQIAQTRQSLSEAGYDVAPVRRRVVALSQRYGGPALDVGTGACACMAVDLAHSRLRVTAVDHASSAVRIAQERAVGKLSDHLEVRYTDATSLPFPDEYYRFIVAFDSLCHAPKLGMVLAEMFRVCARGGAVVIAELNQDGRQVTHHHDGGFEKKLFPLLAVHCQGCQQLNYPHHVVFVCEKA